MKWLNHKQTEITPKQAAKLVEAELPEGSRPITTKELLSACQFICVQEAIADQIFYLRTGKAIERN